MKTLRFLLPLGVLGIVILANTGHLPHAIRQLYDFPYGDKLGHFLLMGLLSFVLNWTALASHPIPKPVSVILRVSLIFAFVVSLEEFSQQLFPRRTFSLLDLVFSYAGIASSALLVWALTSYSCQHSDRFSTNKVGRWTRPGRWWDGR